MVEKLRSLHLLFIALGAALGSVGLGLPQGSKAQLWVIAIGGGLGTFGGVLARGWMPPEPKQSGSQDGEQKLPGSSARALLPLLALFSLTGCATYQKVTQLSLIELERGHTEISAAAKAYDAKVTVDFKDRAAKAKTPVDLASAEAEFAKYKAGFAKFVDVMNKAWACIQQARAALPIIDQVSDKKRRAELTGYITSGLSFVLQAKDTLSAFGVQIGGAQ